MFASGSQSQPRQRTPEEIAAAMARFENRTVIKEQAVNRYDVMVASFSFIHDIFRANGWQFMFSSNKVFPRLVREFYANMEIGILCLQIFLLGSLTLSLKDLLLEST